MLKRNLFVILIISLALVFTTNVLAQNSKRKMASNAKTAKSSNQKSTRLAHPTRTNQATQGTIPVYRDIKSPNKRKSPTKPVQHLEQANGGMTTADEAPEFGERNAKPKDLVKNNPEAKPALLEFQIPEKIVTDNNDPDGLYRSKNTIKKPQSKGYTLDGKGNDVNVEERVTSPRKRTTSLKTTAKPTKAQIKGKQPLGWNWGVDANGNPVQYRTTPHTKVGKTKKP